MPRSLRAGLALAAALRTAGPARASDAIHDEIDRLVEEVMPRVVEWRRDLHRNPELGNRELRTAGKIAEHRRSLGLEVRTGIAHTGVVGLLRGGRPGPVVALRSDMDALPVTEETDLEFRSTARAEWQGRVPGLFVFLGVTPEDRLGDAAPNHSPRFFADEGALPVGVRAMASLAVDHLVQAAE
jgi:amidohydrolase